MVQQAHLACTDNDDFRVGIGVEIADCRKSIGHAAVGPEQPAIGSVCAGSDNQALRAIEVNISRNGDGAEWGARENISSNV
jgi:hypothetical protein